MYITIYMELTKQNFVCCAVVLYILRVVLTTVHYILRHMAILGLSHSNHCHWSIVRLPTIQKILYTHLVTELGNFEESSKSKVAKITLRLNKLSVL
jgi:hypothetical protein